MNCGSSCDAALDRFLEIEEALPRGLLVDAEYASAARPQAWATVRVARSSRRTSVAVVLVASRIATHSPAWRRLRAWASSGSPVPHSSSSAFSSSIPGTEIPWCNRRRHGSTFPRRSPSFDVERDLVEERSNVLRYLHRAPQHRGRAGGGWAVDRCHRSHRGPGLRPDTR